MTLTIDDLPYSLDTLFDEHQLIELTQSAISVGLACDQKLVLQYLMLLRRKGLSVPLIIGGAFHKAMECLMQPGPESTDDRLLTGLSLVDRHFDRAIAKSNIIESSMLGKIEYGRVQTHAIFRAWVSKYGRFEEWNWTVTHTEHRLRSKLPTHGPLAGTTYSLLERMAGMMDSVIRDSHQDIYVGDYKTKSPYFDGVQVDGMELNTQALWYAIFCTHILVEAGILEKPPAGFIQITAMKPTHTMKATFDITVKYMVEKLIATPEKYFIINPVKLGPEVLSGAMANFIRIVARMDALRPPHIIKNTDRCGDFGGCEFCDICVKGADVNEPLERIFEMPEIAQYEIRAAHSELEKDDDDNDGTEENPTTEANSSDNT